MADASFDAVIVGAGHNGMCLAAYLARAGLSVGMFERRHEDGGGVHTEEATVPGFHHNLHAQYMEFIDYMPFYHDFELEKLGGRMIQPEAQLGITFADGRPPIILYHPKYHSKTFESIARYSEHDAKVWCDLKRVTMENDGLIAGFLYTPPGDAAGGEAGGERVGELMELWVSKLGLPLHWLGRAPKNIIDDLIETPELRALLYRQCIEWGANLHASNGAGFLMCVLWLSGIHYMSVGGTHTLAHAMANACLRQGVVMRFCSPVVRINLMDNRAVGVTLKDGSEVEAKRLVASNADPRQTFMELVGQENLTPVRLEHLSQWRYGPEHVLGTPSFALHQAPEYKSARWDPTINKTFYTVVGFEDDEQVSNYILEAYGGSVPKRPGAGTWVNSLWDPTQAPAGKHAMNGWFFFPRASCLSEQEWEEVRRTYNERFLALWQEYAPNMTRENVIADKLYTSFDMERKIAMPEGDFSHGRSGVYGAVGGIRSMNYRSEIEGLYMCGSSASGGGVSAAGGYNAFKIICEDLNLPRVWQQPWRDY
ncbi:MAG: NAD(P)/FAD-dependent oxidoreductase [Dehalococcoidia bacterium]